MSGFYLPNTNSMQVMVVPLETATKGSVNNAKLPDPPQASATTLKNNSSVFVPPPAPITTIIVPLTKTPQNNCSSSSDVFTYANLNNMLPTSSNNSSSSNKRKDNPTNYTDVRNKRLANATIENARSSNNALPRDKYSIPNLLKNLNDEEKFKDIYNFLSKEDKRKISIDFVKTIKEICSELKSNTRQLALEMGKGYGFFNSVNKNNFSADSLLQTIKYLSYSLPDFFKRIGYNVPDTNQVCSTRNKKQQDIQLIKTAGDEFKSLLDISDEYSRLKELQQFQAKYPDYEHELVQSIIERATDNLEHEERIKAQVNSHPN